MMYEYSFNNRSGEINFLMLFTVLHFEKKQQYIFMKDCIRLNRDLKGSVSQPCYFMLAAILLNVL